MVLIPVCDCQHCIYLTKFHLSGKSP
jgi:hypothetical protein